MSKKQKAQIPVETPVAEPVVEQVAVAEPVVEVKVEILRKSTVIEPVAKVWLGCDAMTREAEENSQPKPRRKDVCNSLIAAGIAFHTARTQYQCWSHATDGGRLDIRKMNPADLPKSVRNALYPPTAPAA